MEAGVSELSFFHPPGIPPKLKANEPLFQENDGNVVVVSGLSVASFFSNVNELDNDMKSFKAFISSRLNYLNQLEYLGENWASGKATPPSLETLDFAKEILAFIKHWYINSQAEIFCIPTITMGPIPTGGISFEISPISDIKLYINIFNNGQIEMEIDNRGFFSDIPTNKETINTKIAEILSQYSEGRQYTGWGNLIQIR